MPRAVGILAYLQWAIWVALAVYILFATELSMMMKAILFALFFAAGVVLSKGFLDLAEAMTDKTGWEDDRR